MFLDGYWGLKKEGNKVVALSGDFGQVSIPFDGAL